ncbi:hypothetical protein BO85DRAFT_483080 [Aspergillus piperis CBS 112811]|uniref:Uncharacterized protein n=1 Tax=Aspergillus piperis CBS 112811 TaxID=1448313 RepID=A0A8G1RBN1_9EURO|nr:hypothetical protein BO85DRAFT_483080 [Aspergillus piperis CBS 112811]RAH63223.1 hypothetical protein BO85DRAFT_483080 [Aspergillus piperis CBS 112811]
MSLPSPWRTNELIIPCQHIREYPAATTGPQNDVLHLAVKQYLPTNNPKPRAEDITIVIAPGSGFGKELYEPVFQELLVRYGKKGLNIRSIWAADPAHQGESGIINEGRGGIDREPLK